jgi:hypothetical protein
VGLEEGKGRREEVGVLQAMRGQPRRSSGRSQERRGPEKLVRGVRFMEGEEMRLSERERESGCLRRHERRVCTATARTRARCPQARAAAHETSGSRQLDGSGLRHHAPSSGVGSMATWQGKAVVGQLRGRTPAPCPPGVRCWFGPQSARE